MEIALKILDMVRGLFDLVVRLVRDEPDGSEIRERVEVELDILKDELQSTMDDQQARLDAAVPRDET